MAQRRIRAAIDLEIDKAFKTSVKEVNDSLRVLSSEMKLVTADFAENADSAEALRAKYDVQERQLLTLNEKIKELESGLQHAASVWGEADEITKGWQVSLNETRAAAAKLNGELEKTAKQIEKSEPLRDKDGQSFADYAASIGKSEQELKLLSATMRKIDAQFEASAQSVDALMAKNKNLADQAAVLEKEFVNVKSALSLAIEEFGGGSAEVENLKIRAEDLETSLIKTKHAIELNSEAIKEAGKPVENLTEKISDAEPKTVELGDAVDKVSRKLGIDLPDGATKALNGLGKVNAGAVAAAGAVAGLAVAAAKVKKALDDMTLASGQRAEELMKLSSVSGVSTDALQKFQYAADFVGVSSDTLADSLKDLTKNMGDAANGNEEYAAKFDALGVSITNTDGSLRDSYDVFLDVIDALGEMGNKTERDAAAMGLINESAQQLNPLIEAGTDALRAYGDEAERMGAVLSGDNLKALKAVDDAQNQLKKTQEAVTEQISLQYAPQMKKALEKNTELVEDLGGALIDSGVVSSFERLLVVVTDLFDPIKALAGDALPVLKTVLDGISRTLATIADVADAASAVFTLNFTKFNTALGKNAQYGMLSHQQKWYYGDTLNTNVYDPTVGGWVGNGGYNAGGTDYWRGGMTRVGETGPETVYLPQGAQIRTAQESRGEHATVVIQNMTVDASSLQSMQDIIDFFDNLERYSRMGVT